MAKAVIIGFGFEWDDVKKAKNYTEFYDMIGLTELIKNSIDDPKSTGGEIIKKNVYATSTVCAKLASMFSGNILKEILKDVDEDNLPSLERMLSTVANTSYELGFEAGLIGPELTDLNSPSFKAMEDTPAKPAEDNPAIYVLQSGTDEFVEPEKGEAKEFLRKIKSLGEAIKRTDEEIKKLNN